MKKHKKMIISKLVDRIKQIDPSLISSLNYSQEDAEMHYYLIYAVLKYLNLNLGFSRFSQAILKNTGYSLNSKRCN